MEFYEQIIKQKKNGKDYAIIGVTVLLGLLFVFVTSLLIPFFLPLWIFIPCWFGYFVVSGRCLEFEYSITNHVIDIDRIAGKRRRRKMIIIDLKEIQGYGIPGDEGYRHAIRNGLQLLDFSTRIPEESQYYLIVPRPKGTYIVVITPDETMKLCMKPYLS